MIRQKWVHSLAAGALTLCAAGNAMAITPFQQDVATAIDRGIEWMANQGYFNNPSPLGSSGAIGLPMQALLEKRASGNPGDPPQGYNGASATDQARLRSAAAYILDIVNETSIYAYRDGQAMFALSGYALTGGPDKSALGAGIAGNADYQTIKQAMDALTDRTLAGQQKAPAYGPTDAGYWCYNGVGCDDSSTTQFSTAGLEAARTFYKSAASGDGGAWADPARVALIDTALALTKTAYELNGRQSSDNASCAVMNPTERGHGYRNGNVPSLQQTASGIYIQLFGGSNLNTPSVQNYMQWIRNRYRYSDLDSMGNSWPGPSYSYYMWSSFKGMELIRQSGIVPAAGNLGPNDYGTLPAATAPTCPQRQEHLDPATVTRVASFGAGGAGFYNAETQSQYFDYARTILGYQCYDGSLPITGTDGNFGCGAMANTNSPWEAASSQSYLLLVLQRSVGNVVQACDIDGDFDVDTNDLGLIRAAIGTPPVNGDPRDANLDGKITMNDWRFCALKCTRASCAVN